MVDMIFLELALALVIVATLAAVAPPAPRGPSGHSQQGGQRQLYCCPRLGGDDRLVLLLATGIERLAWSVEGSDAVMVLPTLRDGRFAPPQGEVVWFHQFGIPSSVLIRKFV